MHYREILDLFGATNQRLREICTSKNGDNLKIRKRWEKQIRSRIESGVKESLRNSAVHQAVNMAWDAPTINKKDIPLLLWAQGKIRMETLLKASVGEGGDYVRKCINKGKAKDGSELLTVDLPRLFNMNIALMRSYVTRRHAAQSTKYANLWPFFRYEPRGTDESSELIGDAVSQVAEKMSDDFNYRHFFPQTDRDKLLYAQSVVFPRQAWTRRDGYRPKGLNVSGGQLKKEDVESYIRAEGIDFVNPPAERICWDTSAPLPNINTDTGPDWIFYWGMEKFGTFMSESSEEDSDGGYFNTESITHGETFSGYLNTYGTYFESAFEACKLKLPELSAGAGYDDNDREVSMARYTSGTNADNGVLHTQFFQKMTPKAEGVCDYPFPIWVRFTVLGDGTIIGAEFLPSIPAAYGGFNQHDGRAASQSYAAELLQYQDQVSNLFTKMLNDIRTSMVQLWLLDKDALDEETRKYIKDGAEVRDFFTDPKIIEYSKSRNAELGVSDVRQAFTIVQGQLAQSIDASYNAVMRVLAIVDRLSNTSRNELGESNPREISATEAQEISSTTATMHTFISDGIDEQRNAVKRMIYESRVCFGSSTFEAPVAGRYTKEAILSAGFKLVGRKNEASIAPGTVMPSKTKISGSVRQLVYTYAFDSRDGAERSSNPQSAQLLITLATMLMSSETVVNAMGKRRLFSLLNTIVRQSGAGWDLKLELDPNEDEAMPSQQQIQALIQKVQQLEQMISGGAAPGAPSTQSSAPPSGGAPAEAAPPSDEDAAAMLQEPVAA